MTQQNK